MEREGRKILTKYKKLILIFLVNSIFLFSQGIEINEEIIGKDLSEKKTPIFDIYFFPFKYEIQIPEIPRVELNEEIEKESEISYSEIIEEKTKTNNEKKEIEKGKFSLIFQFGNFSTSNFLADYVEKNLKINFAIFYSENYRENSEEIKNKIGFLFDCEKNKFSINFNMGKFELPGPTINPLTNERNWINFDLGFYKKVESLNFEIIDRFYYIDNETTNFSEIIFEKKVDIFKSKTSLSCQIFNREFSIWGIYQGFIYELEKIFFDMGLKFIEDYGVKFQPNILYKINQNINFFISSKYDIADIYKELIEENWKNLLKEKLPPEESYKIGFEINLERLNAEFSHSYNKEIIWTNMVNNFLYNPERKKFWTSKSLINLSFPNNNSIFFLDIRKNFLDENTYGIPELEFIYGFRLKKENWEFKLRNNYTGERKFKNKNLDSFNILDFELTYKEKFGIGVYNILNEEYEIVPYYPGCKRKFLLWLKF